uniref:Putative secreted protein n=1 Tax=Anopheles marajoara TaxID=58244 RepID=A0A2M4CAB4_9DIPT
MPCCCCLCSLFRWRAALGKAFEAPEGIIDKHPVLQYLSFRLWMGGDFKRNIREVVKVRSIIDRAHLDGYGRRPLPYVLPVNTAEELH